MPDQVRHDGVSLFNCRVNIKGLFSQLICILLPDAAFSVVLPLIRKKEKDAGYEYGR